jgi:sortase (surface protein transpeptidase)
MSEGTNTPSFYRRVGHPLVYSLFALIVIGILGYFLSVEMRPVKSPGAPTLSSIQAAPPEPSNPVSAQDKSSYTVPSDNPRYLTIEKLGVSARILPMGILGSGALDSPKTAWDVGWYNRSAKPGAAGALLIDGHVNDTQNTLGVFGQLHTLAQGDLMQVERGDGQAFTYKVVSSLQIAVNDVDMEKLMKPVTVGRSGLNLITCGGKYDPKGQTFSDRIVVFAEQV